MNNSKGLKTNSIYKKKNTNRTTQSLNNSKVKSNIDNISFKKIIINKGIINNNINKLKTESSIKRLPNNVVNFTIKNNFNKRFINKGIISNNINKLKTESSIKRLPNNIVNFTIKNNFNKRFINKGIINNNINKLKTESSIKKLPVNIIKFTGRNIKSNVNKFIDGKLLKSTNLDTNYESEIGSNTLKSMYTGTLKTERRINATIKTIKSIPEEYKVIKTTIKHIPVKIRTNINNIKIKTNELNRSSRIIYKNIKKGNWERALNEIPIKRIGSKIGKISVRSVFNTGKISTKMTSKGINKTSKSLKNSMISKVDETTDIGTNTVFSSISAVEGATKIGGKGTRGIYRTYNKIKTARIKKINYTKNGTIKTAVTNKLKNNFNKFKYSKATKIEIKKIINKLNRKMRETINYIFSSVLKNPYILGIISILIVGFLIFSSVLNAILGFHASYFISIEPNQAQWISNMDRFDENIRSRVNEHKRVKIISNSGTKADWRDVIVAYYIKNNNNTSLSGGTMTSLGEKATSVDPETWEKVFNELKSYLGTDYLYGGSDPSTGFDCSGLVQYCYGKYGIELPRTTYEQVLCGSYVEYENLQAGDLVFFGTSDDIHHVGVYIGEGQYIHAPQTGDVVKISSLSDRKDFYEARRVFEVKESINNSTNSTDTENKILYTALPNNKEFVDIFYKVEAETGVDSTLLASIAITESSLNPNDVSSAGASGLCQLMPDTFIELGFDISNIFDPYTNVLACAYEIQDLYNYSCIKRPIDMLTAYNGGIGNFMKYGGAIPNNRENQEYSGKVLNFYSQLSNGQQPSAMDGGTFVNSNVNITLSEVYNCFVKFYRKDNSKKKWILRIYTVEEALDNLKLNKEQKEEFYNLKDYNGKFNDEEQFAGYDVNFKFKVK
ncbi:TPA: C40 family peptidase [Clostridium botulinum]|nr:C40 family peptidase [Clostridium botulinum]